MNPTIVSAALDDKDLRDSIAKLVEYYKGNLEDMKTATTKAVEAMQETIKSIGNTKIDFSGTLDSLADAKKKVSTVASSAATATVTPTPTDPATDIVGALRETIRLEEKKREEMKLGSTELRNQNELISERRKLLKDELMTEEERRKAATKHNEEIQKEYSKRLKKAQQPFMYDYNKAMQIPTNSLDDARRKLIELRDIQSRMKSSGLFDEVQLRRVNKDIDNLKAKIERLKSKRPMSLQDVIKMDESSVEAITRKMQALRRVSIDPKNVSQVHELGNEYQRLSRLQSELLGKGIQLTKSNNYLAQSFGYIRNRIVYAMTLGASTNFVKQIYEIRGQYELLERSLGVLVNSFEKGSQIFNELNQMSIKSPFTLMELAGAAKQLTAYNFSAKEVVNTTRRLADLSAALGVPMERLTYNLGQIRAQTVLTARDARDFANAGLPIVKSLSDYYTELEGRLVSTGEVYDRMSKKMVSYNDVMSVLNKMTDEGGKFFDFQAKQAETLRVQMNNLTLAWNNMLNEIGEMNQGLLELPLGVLKSLFQNWKSINQALNDVLITIGLVKGVEIAMNLVMGTSISAINAQVLATKKKIVSDLQRKALTESLTVEEQKLLVTSKQVTAEDYRQVLSAKNLTKQQALLMAAFQGRNKSLMTALMRMGLLTAAEIRSMTVGKALTLVWRGMAMSLKSLGAALISAWPIAVLMGVIDIIQHVNSVSEKNIELNKSVADSAKEASESLEKFLSLEANVEARSKAKQGVLSDESAGKTWKAVREQIETASQASDVFISKLLDEVDLNKRVSMAFDVAEKIKEATYAVSGFIDELKVDQDSWLGGLFGEGLAEDIQDYTDHLSKLDENAEFAAKKNRGFWESVDFMASNVAHGISEYFGKSADEAEQEIRDFATNAAREIRERLGEEGSKDAEKVTESIARVVRAVEDANPKIQGKGKVLFESVVDSVMSDEFGNEVYDKATTLYNRVLEQMKHDSSSAFSGINQDVLSKISQWSPAQEKAFRDAANKIKETLPPAFRSTLDMMMKDLNSRDWKVRVYTVFGNPNEEKKSFYDELKEADSNADAAYAKIQRLTTRINELRAAGKDTTDVTKELTQAQKDLSDAESKGGHSSKQRKTSTKAQKAAESELTKALKEELSTIEKVRSVYKDLTKSGASYADAIKAATEGWDDTVNSINKVLSKSGLKKLNLSDFVGIDNPREIVNKLQSQLDEMVKRGAKPADIQVLQAEIKKLNVDAEKYDLTKITKGLNNELDRLKDEYELAVSLDADPELGNMFADWMGIDVNDLPRTATEYADRATKILNSKLKDLGAKTELPNLLSITDDDMRAFESNKTFTDEQLELVKKGVEASRGYYKKEVDDRIKDWDKLLEKYAEYEYKVNKIQNDSVKERVTFAQQFGRNEEEKSLALNLQAQILAATDPQERQKLIQQLQELVLKIAGDDKVKINLLAAIDISQQSQTAKAQFEEFQKTPEWVTATGDLSGMTNKAIGGLIKSLEKYKKSAKNLDPKQIKNINNALKNLYKEQRKGNPFGAIADMLDRAKERMEDVEPEMESIMKDILAIEDEIGDGKATDEQTKKIDELKERWQTLASVGDVSAQEWVASITSVYDAVKGAIQLFDDLAKAIGGKNASDIEKVFSILDKAGQGAQIGASFGGYGAAIGAVAGALTGVITTFADEWSGNADITKDIEHSAVSIKKLENAYKSLAQASEDAYGVAEMGAKRLVIANKELQLSELRRQLYLEQSRKSKNKDESKIEEIKGQIIDLEIEISNATKEIVNDLLSISSVGDAAENLVSQMIDAFKKGEDYMGEYANTFEDMIDNMIMKAIVGKVIGEKMEKIFKMVEQNATARVEQSMVSAKDIFDNTGQEFVRLWIQQGRFLKSETNTIEQWRKFLNTIMPQTNEEGKKVYGDALNRLNKLSNSMIDVTPSDVDSIRNTVNSMKDGVKTEFEAWMDAFGITFGQDKEGTNLSALQAGIQGITEDTAGALEAYMNGVSQQVYAQTEYLRQIAEVMTRDDNPNDDIKVASLSQILLQLQSSYTVQMSIQGILEGWSSPNGMAVRVEMQ